MAYIGREPQIGNYQICDAISVVNAQAAYTMQVSSVNVIPESVNHMIVSLNGVIQKPGSSYTISSSTITFSSNLATGDSIDFIYLLGNTLDLGTPSDDTVTGAKIVDNAINSEHYTDASIDLAHMSANSIDSNQYVDGSIDTAHIADAQVTLAKLAADSVNATKIADDAISEEHLDVTAVTGHTAETSIADGDLVLIHDASASALRKMTKANFVSGIGGANTPTIRAVPSGNQSISASTNTTVVFNTEIVDTDTAFASNVFTVPSGKGGQYYVSAHLITNTAADASLERIQVVRNVNSSGADVNVLYLNDTANPTANDSTHTISGIVTLAAADTIRVNYYSHSQTSTIKGNGEYVGGTSFDIFKLI